MDIEYISYMADGTRFENPTSKNLINTTYCPPFNCAEYDYFDGNIDCNYICSVEESQGNGCDAWKLIDTGKEKLCKIGRHCLNSKNFSEGIDLVSYGNFNCNDPFVKIGCTNEINHEYHINSYNISNGVPCEIECRDNRYYVEYSSTCHCLKVNVPLNTFGCNGTIQLSDKLGRVYERTESDLSDLARDKPVCKTGLDYDIPHNNIIHTPYQSINENIIFSTSKQNAMGSWYIIDLNGTNSVEYVKIWLPFDEGIWCVFLGQSFEYIYATKLTIKNFYMAPVYKSSISYVALYQQSKDLQNIKIEVYGNKLNDITLDSYMEYNEVSFQKDSIKLPYEMTSFTFDFLKEYPIRSIEVISCDNCSSYETIKNGELLVEILDNQDNLYEATLIAEEANLPIGLSFDNTTSSFKYHTFIKGRKIRITSTSNSTIEIKDVRIYSTEYFKEPEYVMSDLEIALCTTTTIMAVLSIANLITMCYFKKKCERENKNTNFPTIKEIAGWCERD